MTFQLKKDEHPSFQKWWIQRRFQVIIFSTLVIFDAITTYLAIYIWKIGTEMNGISIVIMNAYGGLGYVFFRIVFVLGCPLISYYLFYKNDRAKWELILEKWFWVGAIIGYSIVAANTFYQTITYLVN